MNATAVSLESRLARLQAELAAAVNTRSCNYVPDALQFSQDARQAARADLAIPILEALLALKPQAADWAVLLGLAYAEEQRMGDAVRAFSQAARFDTLDAKTALLHAQASLDAGYPAAQLFEHALDLSRGDLGVRRGLAAALAAEGRWQAAESVLVDALRQKPDWIAGHKSLAALRVTAGDSGSLASYFDACRSLPTHLSLRMAWVGALLQRQAWSDALAVIAEGEKLLGAVTEFSVARTLIAAETQDDARADALFRQNAAVRDPALQIAHLRHQIRQGRFEEAEALALGLMKGSAAHAMWPYLSLIWRLRGDARAQWLDGNTPPIRVFDLDYGAPDLERLAAVLRGILTAKGAPVEQSVRGGIQTDVDRQLFHRTEPEIATLRDKVRRAIRDYVDALPEPVAGHPLLGTPRARLLFSGSWSVSLRGGGFHSSHTHPNGWISSALYVSLPEQQALGAAPAGWIRFGVPPENLGVRLPAYRDVEPKPGRLVLFPSTLWHQTLPFEHGERLVVAFDVMRPRH